MNQPKFDILVLCRMIICWQPESVWDQGSPFHHIFFLSACTAIVEKEIAIAYNKIIAHATQQNAISNKAGAASHQQQQYYHWNDYSNQFICGSTMSCYRIDCNSKGRYSLNLGWQSFEIRVSFRGL